MKKAIHYLRARPVRFAVIALVFTGVIVSLFLFRPESQAAAHSPEAAVLPEVKGYKAVKMRLDDSLGTYGTVSYYVKVNVSSRVEEIADRTYADVGQAVEAGQVLATLKNEYLRSSLELAREDSRGKESALKLAQTRYDNALLAAEKNIENLERLRLEEKQKKLELENSARVLSNKRELLAVDGITREKVRELENSYQSLLLSYQSILKQIQVAEIGLRDSDLVRAGYTVPKDPDRRAELLKKISARVEESEVNVNRSEYQKSKVQAESAEMSYKDAVIRSPIRGIVAMKYIEPGEKVSRDKPLFTIIDIESVYIELPVPETSIRQVKKDQKVELTIDAYPGRKFEGIIETVYPLVDVKTRTVNIRCRIKNQLEARSRYSLLPGMFVRASITTLSRPEALAVPLDAVAEKEDNRIRVFVLKPTEDDPTTAVAVEKWLPCARFTSSYAEVADGLAPGETVAVNNLEILETGARVKLLVPPPASEPLMQDINNEKK